MRFEYGKWKGPRPHDLQFLKELMEIYRNLLLQTGGGVDEALRWMEHFGREYGFFNDQFSLEDFKKLLEESGEARRTPKGFEMTPAGERRIRQDSLNEIFSSLRAGAAGDHRTPVAGSGGERLSETRRWQFGDDLANLDPLASVNNSSPAVKGKSRSKSQQVPCIPSGCRHPSSREGYNMRPIQLKFSRVHN